MPASRPSRTARRRSRRRSTPPTVCRSSGVTDESDDERALRTAQAALKLTQYLKGEASTEHWVGILEEHGLFPNYTLLDDSVSLEVALSSVDPDSQDYRTEHMELNRGSAQALRDFAPGSTFYARGYAIAIDALDLGRDDAVRKWACCPRCGYTQDVTDAAAPGGTAGRGRARAVATRVSPTSRSRSRWSSSSASPPSSGARKPRDRRPARRARSRLDRRSPTSTRPPWRASGSSKDYGFGARYQRQMTIRWLNLGKASAQGATVELAGRPHDVALFRVCERCGKLDTSTGANRASEHRPWCPVARRPPRRSARWRWPGRSPRRGWCCACPSP